jgi:hypothetical protein
VLAAHLSFLLFNPRIAILEGDSVMNTVIQQLRRDICELTAKGSQVRTNISSLKWREGSLQEIQKIRSERDNQGRKVNGKRALAPFRRPETGGERSILWSKKRDIGYGARYHLLVYGMLRGRAFLKIEPNHVGKDCLPSTYAFKICLKKYLPDSSITEDHIQTWIDGGEAPVWKNEVAAA